MAADYLNLIRKVQPVGPYNLLGWSFGGLVAHTIATHLQSTSHEVALLALLDSYPVEHGGAPDSLNTDNEVRPAEVDIESIRGLLDILRREGLSTLKEDHYEAIMDTFRNNTRLVRSFVPRRFHGDISLFVAIKTEAKPPIDAWRPFVGGEINVHFIDCAHENMMDLGPAAEIGNILTREIGRRTTEKREERDKPVRG
jgi:thioesterase domain-containing protein